MVDYGSLERREFQPGEHNLIKAVCKRCHCVMDNFEPGNPRGEFYHPKEDKNGKMHWCKNAGVTFDVRDPEVEPFQRKRDRRRQKRLGISP
jgi:hypothetical protein